MSGPALAISNPYINQGGTLHCTFSGFQGGALLYIDVDSSQRMTITAGGSGSGSFDLQIYDPPGNYYMTVEDDYGEYSVQGFTVTSASLSYIPALMAAGVVVGVASILVNIKLNKGR